MSWSTAPPPTGHRRTAALAVLAVAVLAGGTALASGAVAVSFPPASRASAATTTTTAAPLPGCDDPATLSVRQRLARMVMVGVDGASATEIPTLLGRPDPPGGVFIGGQATEVFTTLPGLAAARRTLIAVDEEGGRVQRIDALDGSVPSPRSQASTLGVDGVRRLARQRGEQLAARGVTMDLAPVVDVTSQADGDVIGDRSYGDTAAEVTRYAGAFAEGLRSAGVLPTLKHFPGHGRASGDSHKAPVSTPPLADLEKVDLVPYRKLVRDSPVAVLVGHLDVPGLTEAGLPASLSPAAYRYLRVTLGFDGLALTDDVTNMAAVRDRFGVAEAAERALVAGADLVLVNDAANLDPVLSRMEEAHAAGRLGDERILAALRHARLAAGCAA